MAIQTASGEWRGRGELTDPTNLSPEERLRRIVMLCSNFTMNFACYCATRAGSVLPHVIKFLGARAKAG